MCIVEQIPSVMACYIKPEIEEWKYIDGTDKKYLVSKFGRVASLNYKQRIMSCFKSKFNYRRVSLCHNGKKRKWSVHRLVAMAFIPNPNGYEQINHIDMNKENNRFDNLEWCTAQQNIQHYYRMIGGKGHHISEKAKQHLRELMKGKPKSKETKAKISESLKRYNQRKRELQRQTEQTNPIANNNVND